MCPVVGRRPQHVVSKWPCLVLSSAISCRSSICPGRLSTAWLVSLDVFSCHMVSKWWRARSIGRLWGGWYALPRTISFFSQCRLYLWVLSSPYVGYVCWDTSFHKFVLCLFGQCRLHCETQTRYGVWRMPEPEETVVEQIPIDVYWSQHWWKSLCLIHVCFRPSSAIFSTITTTAFNIAWVCDTRWKYTLLCRAYGKPCIAFWLIMPCSSKSHLPSYCQVLLWGLFVLLNGRLPPQSEPSWFTSSLAILWSCGAWDGYNGQRWFMFF